MRVRRVNNAPAPNIFEAQPDAPLTQPNPRPIFSDTKSPPQRPTSQHTTSQRPTSQGSANQRSTSQAPIIQGNIKNVFWNYVQNIWSVIVIIAKYVWDLAKGFGMGMYNIAFFGSKEKRIVFLGLFVVVFLIIFIVLLIKKRKRD